MLIKSCRRKDPSFDDLLRYLAAEGKSADKPLFHNFPPSSCHTLDDIIRAFMDNARHLRTRRNGNALYQEIVSFHPDDAAALTPAILRDLAARYLERRAPGAMAYAAIHHDRAHPHIHLVISANLCGQPKKLRLSRQEFDAAKRELEAYQKERYPELRHSLVFDDTKNHLRPHNTLETLPIPPAVPPPGGVRENERKRRLTREGRGVASRKEFLHHELLRMLTCAASWEVFVRQLQAAGIEVYYRGGRPYGIIQEGQKYRFTTLGIAETLATAGHQWQRLPVRLHTIKNERAERARRFVRSFGYAKDMLEVVEGKPADPGHRQLRQDRRERRHRQREEKFRSHSRGNRSPDRSL